MGGGRRCNGSLNNKVGISTNAPALPARTRDPAPKSNAAEKTSSLLVTNYATPT